MNSVWLVGNNRLTVTSAIYVKTLCIGNDSKRDFLSIFQEDEYCIKVYNLACFIGKF